MKERWGEDYLDIPMPKLYARLRWLSDYPGLPVTHFQPQTKGKTRVRV